jgi:hypothetical protein
MSRPQCCRFHRGRSNGLWNVAIRLTELIEGGGLAHRLYVEALGVVTTMPLGVHAGRGMVGTGAPLVT